MYTFADAISNNKPRHGANTNMEYSAASNANKYE